MKKSSLFIMMALSSLASWAQTTNIKGTVVDDFGEPVIGASVLEKGTRNGGVTDLDGNITINDAVGVVNMILNNSSANAPKKEAPEQETDEKSTQTKGQ